MAAKSSIEWTESTWNPVTGCSKVSAGCLHCYAERMAKRLKAIRQRNYRRGFKVTLHEHMLQVPLRWKKPHTIFVDSMSDLFHEDVPLDFILRVFGVMNHANWHLYQILTKRSERLRDLDSRLPWACQIWMGVTVEAPEYTFRIDHLRSTGAHVKFVSLEPLLGPISQLDLTGIHWVIVGGESGPNARPIERCWVVNIRDQCQKAGVPFFFKQWGGQNKRAAGRLLEGRTWDGMPSEVRCYPAGEVRVSTSGVYCSPARQPL